MLKTTKKIKSVLAMMVAGMTIPTICHAQITISADSDVTPTQIATARDTAVITEDALEREYGLTLNRDVEVYLHGKGTPQKDNTSGNSVPGKIFIWLSPVDKPYKTSFLVAHELTHQYQLEQVGNNTMNKNMWFTEGMADIVGVQIANAYDKTKYRVFARAAAQKTQSHNILLSWIESRTAWRDAYQNGLPVYAKADMGLLYLTSKYPQELMWSYLYNLKESDSASEALQKTYGLTSEGLDKIIG